MAPTEGDDGGEVVPPPPSEGAGEGGAAAPRGVNRVRREKAKVLLNEVWGGGDDAATLSEEAEEEASRARLESGALGRPVRDWRDKRPFNVASHWAIPPTAKGLRDLEDWTDDDVKNFMIKFATTDGTLDGRRRKQIEHKIAFLQESTTVRLETPLEHRLFDTATAKAAAAFSSHRTEAKAGKCIVKHPEDCKFHIPVIGIQSALQRALALRDGMTDIQRMLALEEFTASVSTGASAGSQAAK